MQPFEGSVTVTMYVEGTEMLLVAVVTPPPQLNVAPLVVDEALNVSLVVVHVSGAGEAMLALGGKIF